MPWRVLVARVFSVDRDSGITQHGFRTGGGDDQMTIVGPDNGIADMPQVALGFDVGSFEIGERGAAARTPVDHVGAAVDEPFFVQADEGLADSVR